MELQLFENKPFCPDLSSKEDMQSSGTPLIMNPKEEDGVKIKTIIKFFDTTAENYQDPSFFD